MMTHQARDLHVGPMLAFDVPCHGWPSHSQAMSEGIIRNLVACVLRLETGSQSPPANEKKNEAVLSGLSSTHRICAQKMG
jgi:hypothetical protein